MLFITKWKVQPDNFIAAIKRFTSGDPTQEFPDGVRLVGRWHAPASSSGVAILESDNPEAVMKWTLKWNDLMDITLEPVIEDEQVGPMAAERLAFLDEN